MKHEHVCDAPEVAQIPLATLAHHVRQSLLQISQLAQAGADSTPDIDAIASTMTRVLDGYILSGQAGQLALEVEPVSLGAVLQDVLHELTPAAKQHECHLRFVSSGSNQLVAANRRLVHAAFLSLGHSFIEAQTLDDPRQRIVALATRYQRGSQTAGVFSPSVKLSAAALAKTRRLAGIAAQQSSALAGSNSGIIVADALLGQNSHSLYASTFQKIPGLAAAFIKNKQMQLV